MAAQKLNAIERAIESISPRWARKRAADRMALSLLRAYEGASKGRRTEGWKTAGSGANAEIRASLQTLRNRCRALVRDNPYAARAVSVIVSNMIGYGIMGTPQHPNKAAAKRLAAAYKRWSESTQCDFDGRHNMAGLQELAANTIVQSGEVLVRRRWVRDPRLTVPLQLQVLEPDFLDQSKEGPVGSGGDYCIQGVQFNSSGKRVGYWLFEQHPGEVGFGGRGWSHLSKFVDASEILHVFRQERPGQVRGVPWAAPVIIRLRDFDEYEDAQLVRQKIAACFTAFVHDTEVAENTGAGKSAEITERLEPAMIEFLPPGKSITFASPPSVQNYAEYTSVILHSVAVGFGVPYESLTGDYSGVNFTSGRMGRTEFHANLDRWQWNMFVPQFCQGVFGWFAEAATLAGLPGAEAYAQHTPPRRTLTDPTREIPTMIKAVRGGAMTLPQMIREMGYTVEEFLQEIADSNKLLDSLKITLDSDPRKVTAQGQVQTEPANDNADDNSGQGAA